MRATSQMPTLVTNLVAVARSVLPGVDVWDGLDASGNDAADTVWIGVADPNEPAAPSVTGSSRWASLGTRARDETFTVYCAVLSWTGEENNRCDGTGDVYAALRSRAFSRVAALETALRDDPAIGQLLVAGDVTLTQCEVQVTRVVQAGDNHGSSVTVQFQFDCWCRI